MKSTTEVDFFAGQAFIAYDKSSDSLWYTIFELLAKSTPVNIHTAVLRKFVRSVKTTCFLTSVRKYNF